MFSVEKNEKSLNKKHALMMNNKCIACFSNKKHALKMMHFLNWYENRFGAFVDIEQAANQLHRSIKNSGLAINFDTLY